MQSGRVTLEHRNVFMGLLGIENGATRLDKMRVPAADLELSGHMAGENRKSRQRGQGS